METSIGIVYQTAKKFSISGKITFIDMECCVIKTVDKRRIFLKENKYHGKLQDFINISYERCLSVLYQRIRKYKNVDFDERIFDQGLDDIVKTLFVIEIINSKDKHFPLYYDDDTLIKEVESCNCKGVIAFNNKKAQLIKKLSKYKIVGIISESNRKFVIPSSRLYRFIAKGKIAYGITILPDVVALLYETENKENQIFKIKEKTFVNRLNKSIYNYEKKHGNNYIIGFENDLKILNGQ